ncbi:MAG: DUF6308 family protein [Brooklawnia sp.]|jgi:hypothetical protein
MTGICLTPSLQEGNEDQAAKVLQFYYGKLDYLPLSKSGNNGFTGGQWDDFDPSGTRACSQYEFTSEDLLSSSLLSTAIGNWAVHDILVRRKDKFNEVLEGLAKYAHVDFVDLTGVDERSFPEGWELWRLLRTIPRVGPTRSSKLMARKFPWLFPIYDSVIKRAVLGGSGNYWVPLHEELRKNDRKLHKRLLDIRGRAQLDSEISPLRVFDVLAWMDGTGKSRLVLT